MLNLKKTLLVAFAGLALAGTVPAQNVPPGSVLVLYNPTTSTNLANWTGGAHAQMLANLLGHFDLPYVIRPIENYQAGDLNAARATFYLGTDYYAALPAAFTNDVFTTTNVICWFKYHIWNIAGANFESQFGFRFNTIDPPTNYSKVVVYKGETFPKADSTLISVSILNSNIATVPATANLNDTNGAAIATIPYVVHAGNLWHVADDPFNNIADEDRYIVFCDLLHDILGINHAESHRAVIRIEDVSAGVYTPQMIRQIADLLHSNAVPFALATIPVWTDPLGYWSLGTPVTHRISDGVDYISVDFLNAIRYATNNGAQIIIHGYTHQYGETNNPGSGASGDDYEFWRKTNGDPTNNIAAISRPVPEDSEAWVSNRLALAKHEITQAGLSWVAWETPHYLASALDCRIMATNFPLLIQRGFYFATDYDLATNGTHYLPQFFPYVINRDIYGCKLMPENLGYYSPNAVPARLPADIIRVARKNLVVRDGWANAYFHGYLPLTNMQAIVSGIQALGYTYVPLVASSPTLNLTAGAVTNTIALSFATQPGFNYHVEYKNTLASSVWLEWTNAPGTGNPLTLDVPIAAAQRFIRLRVE